MEKVKTMWQALSDFQAECPAINKGAKGYGYKYADLPSIMDVIQPLLRKHKLVLLQPLLDRSVTTKLVHIPSGESQTSSIDIPDGVMLKGMNQFQSDGSAITYYRRYALSSMLGIVVDEDTDAAGAQVTAKDSDKKKAVIVGGVMFKHCVERYGEGMTREEMTEHVSISDSVWKQIVVESNKQKA